MTKKPSVHLKVVNDNGNSEQELIVNGVLIRQPNVYCTPTSKFLGDKTPESLIPDLLNEIDVTISSPSISSDRHYFIGNKAMKSSFQSRNMDVLLEPKFESDVPIINTLGTLAAFGIQEYFNKNKKIPSELAIVADMFTALPIEQWTPDNAKRFASRFKTDTPHIVMVHINSLAVPVSLEFDLVKVAPEGTPALFSLIFDEKGENRNGDMFEEYSETYKKKLTGKDLLNKRIAHIDIGDGTTDFPITEGYNFNTDIVMGTKNGVGHAIQEAFPLFKKANPILSKVTRQKFSEYLKDEEARYHEKAKLSIHDSLLHQGEYIYKEFLNVLSAVENEIDIIVVYGGGSILMKDTLSPLIFALADTYGIEVIWVPEKHAALMNVYGLQFMMDNMYEELKDKETVKTK
jgi:plasmid segregation protein ParM